MPEEEKSHLYTSEEKRRYIENFTTDDITKKGLLVIMDALRHQQLGYSWESSQNLSEKKLSSPEAPDFYGFTDTTDKKALRQLFDTLYNTIDEYYDDHFKLKKGQVTPDWDSYSDAIKNIQNRTQERLTKLKGNKSVCVHHEVLKTCVATLTVIESAYKKTTPDAILIIRELIRILKALIDAITPQTPQNADVAGKTNGGKDASSIPPANYFQNPAPPKDPSIMSGLINGCATLFSSRSTPDSASHLEENTKPMINKP